MIWSPSVPLSTIVNLANIAKEVMHTYGQIRLGMFVYALRHGPRFKYGAMLEPLRKDFLTATDEQLLVVYELVLGELDRAFPDMTCGIDEWRFEFGYTAPDIFGASSRRRMDRGAQRAVDLELGRHPDAKTSTRGTLLPGTTWYRVKPETASVCPVYQARAA